MRITREQATENRKRVIDIASRLFRDQGFSRVGVADLMKASGFTHGGFYNHFVSKEELSIEALRHAFVHAAEIRARARSMSELISSYLSDLHRRSRASGCPAAALATEASRSSNEIKLEFADGIEGMIRSFQQLLPDSIHGKRRRRTAVDLLCTMVGALALARAVPDNDRLAKEILQTARGCCGEIAGSDT